MPPLAEALDRLERIETVHAHEPPDHHDRVIVYTDQGLVLLAFVVAVWQFFRR